MSEDEPHPEEPGHALDAIKRSDVQRAEAPRNVDIKPTHDIQPAGDAALLGDASEDGVPSKPVGLIEKFKLSNLRSRKELEAVSIVLDARLDEMRHQADAASRESKAYWGARSAEVVSAMKTFVQARLRATENERMASRFDSIEGAYLMFAAKVRDIEAGPLPEDLRESLIRKLHANLTETIERLENDALAEKYDLTD